MKLLNGLIIKNRSIVWKLKYGEYIRTELGYILKLNKDNIVNVFNLDDLVYIDLENDGTYFEEDKIIKHSKNIIDLIGKDDYVNNHRIKDKWYDYGNECWHLVAEGNKHILKEDIKSILTKEQYEQNSYKIGE